MSLVQSKAAKGEESEEATGVEKLAQESINYVRRGGTLMIYGVYADKARVSWPPSKIFGDEIKVRCLVTYHNSNFLIFSHRSSDHSLRHIASLEQWHTWMAEKST